jgi:DNA-binding FrmR family transcriptional regulator
MSEKNKNLDEQVDKLEAAAEKYASKDTVISIGGYEFTPAKLMIAFTLVTSILGGLYGAFEVYKDYMDMKQKIAEYVTPDLGELYKKLEVLEASSNKTVEYTNEIKNDLKGDLRRIEGVVESIERTTKTDQRMTDASVKEIQRVSDSALKENQKVLDSTLKENQKVLDTTLKEIRRYSDQTIKEVNSELTKLQKETAGEIRTLRREVDDKIKKALDNPLSN